MRKELFNTAIVLGVATGISLSCNSILAKSPQKEKSKQSKITWTVPNITDTPRVTLDTSHPLGASIQAGQHRLELSPFDSRDFILADVNFNQKRWFTNFSGDISGRFTEVASTLSKDKEHPWPQVLPSVLDEIYKYQKEDGHFGVPIDWNKSIDFDPTTDQTVMMPTLWGNGRLLLGLTASAEKFGKPEILEAAKKLGDFYINTVYPRFCNPDKMKEYQQKGQYASAYVTCVYEGMEGLVNLYRLTKETKYLEFAAKFADFHQPFDLVEGHSHGSLSQTGALVMIYEETGDAKYLQRAEDRWTKVKDEGFINACGGVAEKFELTYPRDEGCTEGDWLRLNLLLWKNTGKTKYLDMAERHLWNATLPNQWPSGGYGHRMINCDQKGAFAFAKYSQESMWCCTYHQILAMYKFLSYTAVAEGKKIYYNFPLSFESTVTVDGIDWTLKSYNTPGSDSTDGINMTIELSGPEGAKVPNLLLRVPEWTLGNFSVNSGTKKRLKANWLKVEGCNYVVVSGAKKVYAHYPTPRYLEDRKCNRINMPETLPATLNEVAIRQGPFMLMNLNSGKIESLNLSKTLDATDGTVLTPYAAIPYLATNDAQGVEGDHAYIYNVTIKE